MTLNVPSEFHRELLLCLLISVIVTVMIRLAFTHDSTVYGERYRPFAGALPGIIAFFIMITAFFQLAGTVFPGLLLRSFTDAAHLRIFEILLPLLVYYTILYFTIPFLRKHFHPAFCAVCWVLPNIIYFTISGIISPFGGLIVFTVKSAWLKVLSTVWLCGFIGVMIYRISSHLRFRKELLESSKEITKGHVFDIYTKLLKDFRSQTVYRLGVCGKLSTPLTIGIHENTAVILLPAREYSDEQLDLILRHELVHIQRRDPYTKFCMSVISAAGWFIPFTWLSCAKASQDLEVSCDQTVITHCNDAQRREYASLILSSAGDERGFTTCLAAKAKDLQYRLHRILSHEKKRYGTVLIFLISFAVLCTYGTVSLAQDCGTIADQIEQLSENDEANAFWSVIVNGKPVSISDEAGLRRWICEKELLLCADRALVRNDSLADEDSITVIHIDQGAQRLLLMFSGRSFRISESHNDRGIFYVLKEPFGMEEFNSFISRTAARSGKTVPDFFLLSSAFQMTG